MKMPCILAGVPPAGLERTLKSCGVVVERSRLEEWMRWLRGARAARAEEPVLIVCASCLGEPAWTRVRVRLAEDGRFFVVALPVGSGSGDVVHALREGGYDAVFADEGLERWSAALRGTAEAQRLWRSLFGVEQQAGSDVLVGASPAMQRLREQINRIGPTSATVLVLGESGTGKDRLAQALHQAASGHAKRPFIAVNCTALPRELMEGELFGAAKGAFTGALVDRPGLVEAADGGTLFLDEIGDLDPALQPKLLRFLETRKARRLGSRTEYAVNVRIIAATNANLAERISAGRFREDLYYRLADFSIHLPPLREHPEDIPLLCRHFLHDASERHGRLASSMEPELIEKLQRWSWPGNIRELRATIERLVLLTNGTVLRASGWDPPPESALRATAPAIAPAASPAPTDPQMPLNKRQRRQLALQLLQESGGDQTWVAARLGIHPTTLYRWRQREGVRREKS